MYQTIFKTNCFIPDYKKALIYGRELLEIYRECSKKDEEGNLTLEMAKICKQRYRYVEARELYERAVTIMKERRDRKKRSFRY